MSGFRLLFVVHRYAPFPGGSEGYVRDMAEECVRRGHATTVLADCHLGDRNGVAVTADPAVLARRWHLVIVHGGDCRTQDRVHAEAGRLVSPVLYLIIKPSRSRLCLRGLREHPFLGWSTEADLRHIEAHEVRWKAHRVRHGIVPALTEVPGAVKRTAGRRVFVSAGGFWPHKAMTPLARAFAAHGPRDAELRLFGYDRPQAMPAESERVRCCFGLERGEVLRQIAGADGYIMNSTEEGFGLVLLEAMLNRTPWFARDLAGAHDLRAYGRIYGTERELMQILAEHRPHERQLAAAHEHVRAEHTITRTVDDLERVATIAAS